MSQPSSPARVVLLRDGRWPVVAGVCCWREGVADALAEIGSPGRVVGWAPAPRTSGTTTAGSLAAGPERGVRRLARVLRRRVRPVGRRARRAGRLLGRAVRRARRQVLPGFAAGRVREDPVATALRHSLAGTSVVLAESIGAALAARRAGIGAAELWALVLPPERVMPGQPDPWGESLRQSLAGEAITGILTDSEPARDAVERALSPLRLPVVVLPPLAADRSCRACAAAAPQELAPEQPAPEHSAPGQLALWGALLAEAGSGAVSSRGWSFPLSRLVGPAGRSSEHGRSPWGSPAGWPHPPEAQRIEPGWTSAAQREALRCALAHGRRTDPARSSGRTVAVVGFDLKFLRELVSRLGQRSTLDLTLDEWSGPSARTPGVTEPLVAASQTLVGEWVRPNAAWLSQVKRADQYLVLRLHRFELDSAYPAAVEIDNVDAVVYISPLLGRRIRDELGWPAEKLVYIPNFVDLDWMDRPKYADARFTLGLAGAIPSRKRLDLALDLLAAVRAEDPRFVLRVRTQLPWENRYTWRDPGEQAYYQRCFQRIETDPLLRGAVTFDPFGRDMAAWFRGVGHVLSPSDAEGAPVAVSEGMASGAVPVLRDWPGADDLFAGWTHPSVPDAAAFCLGAGDADVWSRRAEQARSHARLAFDSEKVLAAWTDLLEGRSEQAAGHFARTPLMIR